MNQPTILCALFALLLLASIAVADKNDSRFENWKVKYQKQYRDSNEHAYRKSIFLENLAKAQQLDGSFDDAEFGLTPFSDMTVEEFKSKVLMRAPNAQHPDPPADSDRAARDQIPRNTDAAPASFDWRTRKALTPVKNQGSSCGSCWAFTVAEEIETANFLAGKNLTQLSPQQIVDCDSSNWGCGGGWPATAYAYVIAAGGLESSTNYPYTGYNGACQFAKSKVAQKIKSWTWSSKTGAIDENKMKNDLYTYGPLSVCVSADNWNYYTGGIFSGSYSATTDHCVQLVGYGTQNGVNYWTVKNQWGSYWGEGGYMRLKRGVNQSLIGTYATRAIF